MSDLREVKTYLLRAAKEMTRRADEERKRGNTILMDADMHQRDAEALGAAASALDMALGIDPTMANATQAVGRFRNLNQGDVMMGVAGNLGGALAGGTGFVPVPQATRDAAPWERDQPAQEGEFRG